MSRTSRRVGLVLAVLVLVALAATLALRLYSASRLERAIGDFESRAGSLDVGSYAPPPIANRRDNAALWLRSGAAALLFDAEQNALLERRIRALDEPWTADDLAAFDHLLADHGPARGLMGRAAGLERSSFEIEYRRGAEAEIPDFISLLRAGRLLAVECDYWLERGELAPAMAALHLLERLTAVQRAESVLIAHLAGAAVERLYLDRLEAVLAVTSDIDSLRALRRDLEHLETVTVPIGRALAADTAAVIPWVLRNPGAWPEWVDRQATEGLFRNATGQIEGPILGALGFDQMVAALVLESGAERARSAAAPSVKVDPGDHMRQMAALRSPVPGAARTARMLAPNYLDAVKRAQWTQASRVLGRWAVELRLSRVGHGVYPAQPADPPSSPATGETAAYRLLEDGAVEISFPDTEATWKQEQQRAPGRTGTVRTADFNLRWRLPS